MIPANLQPLANHLWQSTLFAAPVALLTLALQKNRAAVRYWLWLAASVKFLIPFSLLVEAGSRLEWRSHPAISQPQFSYAVDQIARPFAMLASAPPQTAAPSAAVEFSTILLGVWLCGAAIGAVCWFRSWRRINAAKRTASPLDLKLPIPAFSTPGQMEPGVFGIRKPVLLLPEGIMDRLTPAQLEAVFAHELCHVRRRDNLTAAIHTVVETIFWFHPLVWWIRARLVEEREHACDEVVLGKVGDAQDYAEGILNVCKLYLESPLRCVSGVMGSNLKKRVHSIIYARTPLELNFRRKILLGVAGFAVVAGPIAIGIANAPPSLAQSTAGAQTAQPAPSATGASKASSSAQPAKRDYRFEVASIRRGDPSGRLTGPPVPSSPGRFSNESATIVSLARRAFGLRQVFQIEYQPWMVSAYFNVVATIPEGATDAALPIMIQRLLEDRFELVFHRETRRMAGYELVVAKSGPKLAKSTEAPSGKPARKGGDIEMKNGVPQFTKDAGSSRLFIGTTTAIWRGRNKTMKSLAEDLAQSLSAPVMDATGIEGEYDYTLTFTPEAKAAGSGVVMSPLGAAPAQEPRQDEFLTNPLLRDALQIQLGLMLQPVKDVLVGVVVLDSARKEPTEN